MGDAKSIMLIIVIVILIGSAGILTYMISNGQDPLILLNTRATEEDGFSDEATPTPTVSFTSTSPTVEPSESINPTMTPTKTPMPEPSITTLPDTGGGSTITPIPTQVEALPVAGPEDFINPAVISGGILILLALIL